MEQLLRTARRRYVIRIVLLAGAVMGTDAALLAWSADGRLFRDNWALAIAFVTVPALVLVVAGVTGWRVQSRAEPVQRLLTSGSRESNRRLVSDLRQGRLLRPEQRAPAQDIVEVHHRRRWVSFLFFGAGILGVASSAGYDGPEFWLRLAFAVLVLCLGPYSWWSTRQLLRAAADQGIWASQHQPRP